MSKEGNIKQVSKLDNVQLQQRLIHLQSEVFGYRQLVERYQNNYHYSQFDELNNEMENVKKQLAHKEEEIRQIKSAKNEIEDHLKELSSKHSELNDTNAELKDRVDQLEKEKNQLQEERNKPKIENRQFEDNFDKQGKETLHKPKQTIVTSRLSGEEETNILKAEKTSLQVKRENESRDSWFLRNLKQQNLPDK